MAIARKIKGIRASRKLNEEEIKIAAEQGQEINQISSSQMSFDNRLDNLNGLNNIVLGSESYAPNEADLKKDYIVTFYKDLSMKNDAVKAAFNPLRLARISRNEILYNPETGMVAVALRAREYIKSVYGASSPLYKQISAISFRNKK